MGVRYFGLPDSSYSPSHNYFYDDGETVSRGGRNFVQPKGWAKLALNVAGKYSGSWLEDWNVAYHGTRSGSAKAILQSGGLRIAGGGSSAAVISGAAFGQGVYVSPCASFAQGYAKDPFEGEYNIVFLVRVRPGSFTTHYHGKCSTEALEVDREWVVKEESDVRLVAILFKRK